MKNSGFAVVNEIIVREKRFIKLTKDARWLLAYYYLTPNRSHAGYVMESLGDTTTYTAMTDAEVKAAQKELSDAGFIYVNGNFTVLLNWPRFTAGSENNCDGNARRRLTKETVQQIKAQAEIIPDEVLERITGLWGCASIEAMYAIADQPDNRGGDRRTGGSPAGVGGSARKAKKQTPDQTLEQTPDQTSSKRGGKTPSSSSSDSSSGSDSDSGQNGVAAGEDQPASGAATDEEELLVAIADLVADEFNRVFGRHGEMYVSSDPKRQQQLLAIAKSLDPDHAEQQVVTLMLALKAYAKQNEFSEASIGMGNLASPKFFNDYWPGWRKENKGNIAVLVAMNRPPTVPAAAPAAKPRPAMTVDADPLAHQNRRAIAPPPQPAAPAPTTKRPLPTPADAVFYCQKPYEEERSIARSILPRWQRRQCAGCRHRCAVADIRITAEPPANET